MGESLHTVTVMPTARRPGCPFDPPAELLDARRHGPISRYTFPGGRPGWLVTGYDLVRSILADSRFSSRKELMRHPTIDYGDIEIPPAPPGEFLLMDEPRHSRYRKPLMGRFTVRRMRLLTERVEQITTDHLDAMEAAGPPTDLVTAFARPIPAITICELLGVPYQDRGAFQEQVDSFMNGETSDEDLIAAYTATQDYLAELVVAKRANPTDDVLSDLTDSDLTDEELKGMALILLAAGLDTTRTCWPSARSRCCATRSRWPRCAPTPRSPTGPWRNCCATSASPRRSCGRRWRTSRWAARPSGSARR
ncbi:hypothetical protein ACQSSU_08655 [Micromonospora echinospora]